MKWEISDCKIRANKLLEIIEISGGKVITFKKFKCLINLLSFGKEPYIHYEWIDDFFGPYTKDFSDDINQLIIQGIINRNRSKIKYTKSTYEPDHNEFSVTPKYREELVSTIITKYKNNPNHYNILIGKTIAYNMLSPAAIFHLIFKQSEKFYRNHEPHLLSLYYLRSRVTKCMTHDFITFLKKYKFKVESDSIEIPSKYKSIKAHTFEIKIPTSLAEKRYSYLKYTKRKFHKENMKIQDFLNCNEDIDNLKKILHINNILLIEKIPSICEHIKLECKNIMDYFQNNLDHLEDYWNDTMTLVKKLYHQTQKVPMKINMYEGDKFLVMELSEELMDFIEVEGYNVSNELWATLQPSLAMDSTKKGKIRVTPHQVEEI